MCPPFTATTSPAAIGSTANSPRPAIALGAPFRALGETHDATVFMCSRLLGHDRGTGQISPRGSTSNRYGPRMSWDEGFARHYDDWSAGMTADIPFYVELARAADGPLV